MPATMGLAHSDRCAVPVGSPLQALSGGPPAAPDALLPRKEMFELLKGGRKWEMPQDGTNLTLMRTDILTYSPGVEDVGNSRRLPRHATTVLRR